MIMEKIRLALFLSFILTVPASASDADCDVLRLDIGVQDVKNVIKTINEARTIREAKKKAEDFEEGLEAMFSMAEDCICSEAMKSFSLSKMHSGFARKSMSDWQFPEEMNKGIGYLKTGISQFNECKKFWDRMKSGR